MSGSFFFSFLIIVISFSLNGRGTRIASRLFALIKIEKYCWVVEEKFYDHLIIFYFINNSNLIYRLVIFEKYSIWNAVLAL